MKMKRKGGDGDNPKLPQLERRELRQQPKSRRPETVPIKKMTKGMMTVESLKYPEEVKRPTKRSECINGPRPCPFVGCKHHLYLDVNPETGSIKFNFPDLEPWELVESCALDITEAVGNLTLEDTGDTVNLTRERIRQVEVAALDRLKKDPKGLEEFVEEEC